MALSSKRKPHINTSPLISIYIVLLSLTAIAVLLLLSSSPKSTPHRSFVLCLLEIHNTPPSILTSRASSNFTSLLNSSIQNPRIEIHESTKPTFIVSPTEDSHVQSAILCAKENDMHIRFRSGGHDYEGLSYMSTIGPFILIDFVNFRSIWVDPAGNTARVQPGATLGELYYTVAQKAGPNAAFPAGVCPSVGIGGHFSWGGFGTMLRSFGLAADQIVNARLANAKGEILDRESMGEDVFWAVRGGGCCFGIILEFEISLVQVPSNVTVFSVGKTISQGSTKLVTMWQHLAYKLDRRLFLRVILVPDKDENGNKTVRATFNSLFLGSKEELLPMVKSEFPELGLQENDCTEMSWIRSVLFFSGYMSLGKNESVLTERARDPYYAPFKAKSDFVREPIPEQGWEEIWRWFYEDDVFLVVLLDPFGGRMDEIPESETPFPHRKGNMYNVQYEGKWDVTEGNGNGNVSKRLEFMRRLYEFMAPYVSKNPRAAYYNYRDLDLGRTGNGRNASYLMARKWGERYFKGNFRRLGNVKAKVDPENFFRNEQSVPPLFH